MHWPSEALARARKRVETQLDYRLRYQKLLQTSLNWQQQQQQQHDDDDAWLSEAVAGLLLVESWGQYLPEGVDFVGRHENPCKNTHWETICMGLTDMLDLRDMGDEAQSYFETLPAFNRHRLTECWKGGIGKEYWRVCVKGKQ
ncbi:hypothetical protein DFQ27_000143 [Actinomortierella ambigua]|uniref:Uncharacterized protein n=1 Tax=Actinomortierella ambigua TaxID=1343610 RepID=A0A9P6TVV3_9FUNG|nr:hypothetical protein DFQ27_000143 [Actinomortierella ambigua]